jgi:hypothetical protein
MMKITIEHENESTVFETDELVLVAKKDGKTTSQLIGSISFACYATKILDHSIQCHIEHALDDKEEQ